MRPKRPTIRDVAAAAGVSVTTVSDAISGKGRVDPVTRDAVMAKAEELKWAPRRAAQTLRSGRSGIVALCLPAVTGGLAPFLMQTDYYMSVAAAAATRALDRDLMLLLSPPLDATRVTQLQLDGVIVVDPVQGDPSIETATETGLPYVTIDQELGSDSPWWVSADEKVGVRALLGHLADGGAERIALFSPDAPWAWFQNSRSVYKEWCSERNAWSCIRSIDLVESTATSQAAATELLGSVDRPDAIIGLPNGAALGVIRAADQLGLSVPGDLAVVSGVDSTAMLTASPPITALDLMPHEAGLLAVDLIVRRIEGGEPGPTVFSPEMRLRQTS